ncbi:sn-glycerol-3-phosphate ABC transporter ATP-binding protein UgpC [uncultured Clostridium sp.]|uniref:ABC transporter ATP-binding protein n=1 Tax=uncultured Clostridium sp. TaxID=59620 RepID=UPI00262553B6|nr:sn-glycerol-3-phosphate ABC transporter ATP-binding protein UgpC [uncultured Clostridium sp.]
MAGLKLKNIFKIYSNGFEAVKDFNLDIEDKEFIVFVGPSGCGKTTTLRMVAGLEAISKGELYIGDKQVNNLPPKERDIAMVFQNYALYPHMTVFDNMAFALQLRKMPKDEIDKKVREAAKILDIEHLLDRKPKALSGGQRQRVAMGRAIVRSPKVFLMDEPLSNLDAKLRGQMRIEISKLHRELNTTFIYVTHDQVEAMTLGTRIVVMKDGEIQQIDTPRGIYNNPANMFVAGFIGSPQMNFLYGKLDSRSAEKFLSVQGSNEVKLRKEQCEKVSNFGSKDGEVLVGIRPEKIHYEDANIPAEECINFKGRLELIENLGGEICLHITIGEKTIIVKKQGETEMLVGDNIDLKINVKDLHIFDEETQITIF